VGKNNGSIRITDLQSKGKPLEYAVKMLQIPQKFRMDNLVTADRVSRRTIDRAYFISEFDKAIFEKYTVTYI